VLIEAKFISAKTNVGGVQEAILADIYGYTNPRSNFDHIVVFIYDSAHKIRDPNQFVRDLTGVKGISDVIIIPGFNS
jgi:hypothetical protein